MIKLYFVICIFLSFFGCSDSKKKGSEFLDRDYIFIASVLNPDSTRDYKQEVFVGKILDQAEDQILPNIEDPITFRVVATVHNWYQGLVVGSKGAVVNVESWDGSIVQFTEIANGIYRDINDQLKIETSKKYKLSVGLGDKTYTSETIVPGGFDITNINNGDTIEVPISLSPSGQIYIGLFQHFWTKALKANFYRIEEERTVSGFMTLDHTFEENDSKVALVYENLGNTYTPTHFKGTISAVDSNYGKIYMGGTPWTSSDAFKRFVDSLDELSLPKRSNISGSIDVVGVFGSVSQSKRQFYLKGKLQ